MLHKNSNEKLVNLPRSEKCGAKRMCTRQQKWRRDRLLCAHTYFLRVFFGTLWRTNRFSEIIHHRSASHFYSVLGRAFGSHLYRAYDGGHAREMSLSAWSYIGYLCLPFPWVALPHLQYYSTTFQKECQYLF